MLALTRSVAMVVSNHKIVYEFGPDQVLFEWIGGESIYGIPDPVLTLAIVTTVISWAYRHSTWDRWVFAVGGNAHAARLAGIPVEKVITSVYVICSLCAGLAAYPMVVSTDAGQNQLGNCGP